ncbi:MAG: hypothetical protein ABI707_12305 [Ferruginibacter sp.]
MIKIYSSTVNCRGLKISTILKTAKFILAAFILLNTNRAGAQAVSKNMFEDQFDNFRQNNLQEKIFVHTDKNNYVPGEICWFKIYNVDAYFHKPIDLGKVAYVEILDKNNKAVLQAKIALEKGTGDGSLFLPLTLVSGNYRLRAYTNWMKNYGPDYFFEKKLGIINVEKTQAEYIVAQKTTYDIAFFPEGGNLVDGIESRVGFRVVNQRGKGVYSEGRILNEKDETITTFHPLKFGIGRFTFTPMPGNKYKAVIKLPGGEQQVKDLPVAYNSGYAMHLENTGKGQIKITVQTPDKNNASHSIFLFVHTRNVIKAVMSNTIQNGRAEFLLDDTKPGDGISHFTIFNDYRQPVCERLFFKKPVRTLQITASPDQPLYEQRKKINIDISSATEEGKYIPADMSMAVYRVDSLTGIDEQGINNYFLLSADLPGAVESPEYYFTQNNDTVREALDNLMLTNGWRRFKWEDVLSNKKPAFRFLPEINGHIINGKIAVLQPGLPLRDTKAYLSVPGIRTQFQTATANADGNVKFEMKNFYSDGDIIVQTNNEVDSGYRVDIEQPFFTGYSQKTLPPFDFAGQNASLLKMYIAAQVQNTFLYDKLNRSTLPVLDTTAFYLKPDRVYLLDNYVRFTTLEEVLREYVLEVMVRQPNGKFHLPVFDEIGRVPFTTPPLALLDGVPIFNLNKLMAYDPLKIRKLEIVSRQYFLGDNSFDGIINFTTYKGDMPGFEIDPRATIIDYEGLQLHRDFYAPVYSTTAQYHSRLPDFRTLLNWSPRLLTNGKGKAQTGFYTSDIPGRYAIVIQGMSEDGRAGSGVAWFDVKK